jgi:hypothetical protein
MNTVAKLGVYVGGLAVAFGAAFGIGAAADPVTSSGRPTHGGPARAGDSGTDGRGMPGADLGQSTAAIAPPGLAVSQDGYSLMPDTNTLPAGEHVRFRFTVTGPDGAPVQKYTTTHTRDLHLIVVRRDLTGFQHVHPVRDAAGIWTASLQLASGGTYRAFADFTPAARKTGLTLGADISVAGMFTPVPLPAAATTTTTTGGYDVALAGTPAAGHESTLTFTVSRAGSQITDLEPYLGAFGHLVSLRAGDLAYLHTHPAQEAAAGQRGGPTVRFTTEFPTAGTYRLFLDFRAGGAVHTAPFTVVAPAPGAVATTGGAADGPADGPAGGHGH